MDAVGALYIADTWSNRIRKVDPSGTITTVAGNGIEGFSGDGGPATSASLSAPDGIAFDSTGNLYVADSANGRIRRVDPSGTITTVAGNGTYGFLGDGGPATSASLSYPAGIALDSAGALYIADPGNNRVRRVDPAGRIHTVAGNGLGASLGDGLPAILASLNSPSDVALDAADNLYIADTDNNRVRKVSGPFGTITTIAGNGMWGFSGDGGPATDARLDTPSGVTVSPGGTLYISDTWNHRLRAVSPSGTITTVAGNGVEGFSGDGGPATGASLAHPVGLTLDRSGGLHVATRDGRVRTVDPSGAIATVAGNGTCCFSGDGGPATGAILNYPAGVAVDSAGALYLADQGNDRIRRVDPSGTIITVAGNGSRGYSGDGGPATSASLDAPRSVAVDASGTLYIADYANHRIRRVDPAGTITTFAGNGIEGFSGDGGPATDASLAYPAGIALDSAGSLYIADPGNNRVRKVDPSGTITTVAGNGIEGFSGDGSPATSASLDAPRSVAVDASGTLYIADYANHRIRRVDPAGTITTFAGNGIEGFSGDGGPATHASLAYPAGIALDSAGTLHIADYANHRIRAVDPSGTITTVAGNGIEGFSGDGRPATSASLAYPAGIALDPAGRLYIADLSNHRIRTTSH